MPQPIVVNFMVGGVADVQRAFRTIQDTSERAERSRTQSGDRGARERGRQADREAKDKQKAFEKLARETEKWQRDEVRAVERASREKGRIVEREARETSRIQQRSAREAERAQREGARAFERAERDKTAAAAAGARERERAAIDALRRTQKQREAFSNAVGHVSRGVGAGVSRVANTAIGVAGTLLQAGGGLSIADSVQRSTKASGIAADISQSGYLPNSEGANSRKRSTGEILGVARATGVAQGIDTQESLEGLQKFVGISGDLTSGMALLPKLAELARATGSSLSDVAEAAGNVSLNLGGLDKDGSTTLAVMRGLAAQGKVGAVEMRDLAKQIAKVSSAAAPFAGNRAENILKMGALAQEARGEGGAFSAAVAANATTGFATTLKTGARLKAFKEQGINVFADKGETQFRAPEEIIVDSLKKTHGSLPQMTELFKNVMGGRLVAGLSTRFVDAERKEKGSGEAAVRSRFAEIYSKATMSEGDVTTAATERSQEADVRMAKTMALFDQAVSEKLVPKLLELIPTIEKLIPLFVDAASRGLPAFVSLIEKVGEFATAHEGIIKSIADHPIGAIMAVEVTKSVVSANIGGVIARLLGGAGGGGAGAAGGAAAGGLAVGAAVAGLAVGIASAEGDKSVARDQGRRSVGLLIEDAKSGDADRIAGAKAAMVEAQQRTSVKMMMGDAVANKALPIEELISMFTGKQGEAKDKVQKQIQAREIVNSAELAAAIKAAVVTGVAGGVSPPAAQRNVSMADPQRGGTQ